MGSRRRSFPNLLVSSVPVVAAVPPLLPLRTPPHARAAVKAANSTRFSCGVAVVTADVEERIVTL